MKWIILDNMMMMDLNEDTLRKRGLYNSQRRKEEGRFVQFFEVGPSGSKDPHFNE
jgi:hypothetical protein